LAFKSYCTIFATDMNHTSYHATYWGEVWDSGVYDAAL